MLGDYSFPLVEHALEQGNACVSVVVDLRREEGLTAVACYAPDLLYNAALEGDRHCEEERAELRQVESFAGDFVCRDQNEWSSTIYRGDFGADGETFPGAQLAVQNEDSNVERAKQSRKRFDVFDPIRQCQAGAALAVGVMDVVGDDFVAQLVSDLAAA